ncbi:helix-turn-helix domain-containing protein [Lunatimonas salinarum]|uniref:helix-turn-helix domain-containing protein n=1 Tax=Lunatimonas salinarum TaxID=1774590 RepID=UPI001ADF136F|nr:AraC family transcriptional regulator [Lunatimonas salinarum]
MVDRGKINLSGIQIATAEIKSCYMGPEISEEQYIPEHIFFFLAKGFVEGYDGHNKYSLYSGDYCLLRKNNLARYAKQKENDQFEKVVVVFDEPFLKDFQNKHAFKTGAGYPEGTFVFFQKTDLVPNFIRSLASYYQKDGKIAESFSDIKREELLLILLQLDSGLAHVFFDFSIPQKIDLKLFMHQHYRFNVSLDRLAFLTGRSLSTFKRDFVKLFNDTPRHWIQQRRLQEAHYQMQQKNKKPTEVYLDLGFEDLSHFSFAFKKKFGVAPSKISAST